MNSIFIQSSTKDKHNIIQQKKIIFHEPMLFEPLHRRIAYDCFEAVHRANWRPSRRTDAVKHVKRREKTASMTSVD
jgi:hypothetical protein